MRGAINIKRFIWNFIFSLGTGVVLPAILIPIINPSGSIFNLTAIITNGLIYMAVYTALGLFHKDTLYRFFIGIGYILLMIYFYTVGNSVFTAFLPHKGFAYMFISGTIFGIEITLGYGYVIPAIIMISLTGLNVIRYLIKPVKEKKKEKEEKEKIPKDGPSLEDSLKNH